MRQILFFALLAAASLVAPLHVSAQTFTDRSDLLDEQNENRHFSWAASIADLDGNGLPDIYETGHLFLQQEDGSFVSSLPEMGITYRPLPPPIVGYEGRGVFGSIITDVNDDGFAEFVVLDIIEDSSKFFLNHAGMRLKEVSPTNGIDFAGLGQGAAFGDFNGDGPLDLFFGEELGNNQIFLGDGTGQFTEFSMAAGIGNTGIQTYGVATADIDNDGDLDVFIAACSSTPSKAVNLLFLNNGDGTFQEVGEAAGINDNLNAWGVNFLDYDRDGWMDIHLANMRINFQDTRPNTNKLYRNKGDGTFADVSEAAGIEGNDDSYGSSVADFNNDGWPDIYSANFGSAPAVLINNGDGTFTDAFTSTGMTDVFANLSISVADINQDGWVDLFTGADRAPFSRLYMNDGGTNNWMALHLIQPAPNTKAVGARVEVWNEGQVQLRDITAGDGFVSQNMAHMAHFGMGTHTTADSVIVRWPDGNTDRWTGLFANQTITLEKGGGFNEPPAPFRAMTILTKGSDDTIGGLVSWEQTTDPEGNAISYTVAVQDASGEVIHVSEPLSGGEYAFEQDTTGVDLTGPWSFSVAATDGAHVRRSVNVGQVLLEGTSTEAFETPVGVTLDSVWPQPAAASQGVTVAVTSVGPKTGSWTIVDMQGRAVQKGSMMLRAGADQIRLDTAALSAGAYVLVVNIDGQQVARPIILAR